MKSSVNTGTLAQATEIGERIGWLDSARGFALLGILVMNSTGMGLFDSAYINFSIDVDPDKGDFFAWALMTTYLEASMRTLFSILFGAGVILFIERLQTKGGAVNPVDIHGRRMLWLILFGLLNTFLLVYPYDILLWYGIAGLLLFPFRNLPWRKLLILMACFMLIQTLGFRYSSISTAEAEQAAFNEVIAAEEAGKELSDEQEEAKDKWTKKLKKWNGDPENLQKSKDLNLKGNPIELWKNLTSDYLKYFTSTGFWRFLNDVIIAVILGMAMFRAGLMTARPNANAAWIMLILGYGVGLSIGGMRTWMLWTSDFEIMSGMNFNYLYDLRRIPIAIGHLAVIQLLFIYNVFGFLRNMLGAVGRMAFTNYLVQSLLQVLAWTGFGLGLHQQLDRSEVWIVIGIIWVFQAIFSMWWLKKYQMGPLEWVWRSLTYGKSAAMKKVEDERVIESHQPQL
jgi:uncharacterized protein